MASVKVKRHYVRPMIYLVCWDKCIFEDCNGRKLLNGVVTSIPKNCLSWKIGSDGLFRE